MRFYIAISKKDQFLVPADFKPERENLLVLELGSDTKDSCERVSKNDLEFVVLSKLYKKGKIMSNNF